MNKTKIEWCDYTWNPIVGCKRGCPYCYAKKIWDRFKPYVIGGFGAIRFYPLRLNEPYKLKKPSRIFVGSMSDICYWGKDKTEMIINVAKENPQHTFMFLTKDGTCYKNYLFPKNCWLGVTYNDGCEIQLKPENISNIRFLCIEPLIKFEDIMKYKVACWDWVIVGGLTPKSIHNNNWITEIVDRCLLTNKPLFIKNNCRYEKEIKQFPDMDRRQIL